MRKSRPNYRLVKIHRNYTVEDIARLFRTHKNTVRRWIKDGLPTIDNRRPKLILGHHLIDFLKARRASRKRPCQPGEIYCVRCHAPKFPAGGMAEYQAINHNVGNLVGICPDCSCLIYRCVNISAVAEVGGEMDVAFPPALQRLREIIQPVVNSDLRGDAQL
jgi:hypothetical protein